MNKDDIEQLENTGLDMDDPKVKQVAKFCTLFKYRDEMYSKLTEDIFGFFKDNIISSFEDMLQLGENVHWLDAQMNLDEGQEALILTFQLTYTKQTANKFILSSFGYDEEQHPNIRIIKFGVPLYLVFAPKEDVFEFIMNVTETDQSDLDKSEDDFTFDTTKLTTEQLKQLKLFDTKRTLN